MADLAETVLSLIGTIVHNPVYLLLAVGVFSLLFLAIVAYRIHKIHNQDIFTHQAWGANWKGR